MEQPVTAYTSDQRRGEIYSNLADSLTKYRSWAAPHIGQLTTIADEQWPLTVFNGTAAISDLIDGPLARIGAKLQGIETKPKGAIDDHLADKRLFYALASGLFARAMRQGELTTAAVLGANIAVSFWRDQRMERSRSLVETYGLDSNEVKAIPINKRKTVGQMTALVLLSSSQVRRPGVRQFGLELLSVSTLTGVIGERVYHNQIVSKGEAKLAAAAANCPDVVYIGDDAELKMRSAYTNQVL